jgi:hypothetical protein
VATTTKNTTKKKMKNRTVALIAGIGVAVLGGGIAFAYFTGVGSGSGTATVGSNNPIVVNQTSAVTAMGPGIAPQALSGNFTNSNGGPVFIGSVSAVVTGVPAGTPSPGPLACTATDFVITGGAGGVAPFNNAYTTPINRQVPVGTGVDTWSGLTLAFVNKATNQDACKNASITITYTANAS